MKCEFGIKQHTDFMIKNISRIVGIVEKFLLAATVWFAVLWIRNPQGNYEPWTVIFGALLAIIKLARRKYLTQQPGPKLQRLNENSSSESNGLLSDGPDTFGKLCLKIRPLLDENSRIFLDFGPNSDANSVDPVRWDLTLWENSKREIIVPNNRKTAALIKEHYSSIPHEYRNIFNSMLSHIYAFEKHCETPAFDYSEHQFPKAFKQIITNTCLETSKNNPALLAIEAWLVEKLKSGELEVLEGFIFGSALRGAEYPDDFDIIVLLAASTYSDIKSNALKIEKVKRQFRKTYDRYLHVTAFSKLEIANYNEFVSKLKHKRLLPVH